MMGQQGMGLAQQGPQAPQGGISVEQVAQMLMQGADPQELLQKGIPAEIIKAAIQMLQQQQQAQQSQPQQAPQPGLAGMGGVQ